MITALSLCPHGAPVARTVVGCSLALLQQDAVLYAVLHQHQEQEAQAENTDAYTSGRRRRQM